jgi:hypothetical protein
VTQRCIASGLAMFFGASLRIVLSSIDTIFIEIGTALARGARILRQASPCAHCPQSAHSCYRRGPTQKKQLQARLNGGKGMAKLAIVGGHEEVEDSLL